MPTVRSRSLAERIGAATSSHHDLEALSQAVFRVVSADVPFDFACLATVDPASALVARAFKSRPLDVGDEEWAAIEFGGPDVNQFAELATRPSPVGVLSVDTAGEVMTSRRFREFMAPNFGFTDELRLVCHTHDTIWGALGLYRGPGEPAFTARDGELLAAAHQTIADGIRRVLFAGEQGASEQGGAAVLIVDADNRVTDLTTAAQRQIDELGGWDNGSLPANVLSVATRARTDGETARALVPGLSGRWLALQAMTLAGPGAGRSVVVTVGTAPPSEVGQLALAARGLTVREQDVARLVLQGASTKVIAASLFLSPHTVQDHLKAIFRKLGVTSRREMIAQLVLPL